MSKKSDQDVLFLLPPGFFDKGQREYCPECAEIWGLLSWYPAIREALDIVYVPLAHPRHPITDRLGAGDWNAPTLVLASNAELPDELGAKQINGAVYFDTARSMALYFSYLYGTARPRGGP